jgi:ABC-2 type transport system ATP-binding protein
VEAVIRLEGLTKYYGKERGVVGLDLEVYPGEVLGYLGPNGAGKTTTIRLLNGTLTPSAGTSRILGLESREEEVRRRTSTLAEEARMYEHMSVLENLRFFAAMYDMPPSEAQPRIRTLLERMRLWDRRELKLGSFSTGMKKRVYLCRTLLHRPEIVFLDEPTSGLDPEAAMQVTDLIRNLAAEHGTTIFLCTHNLFLAERICGFFGFIRGGVLVAVGSREELIRANTETPRVEIRTDRGTERFNYGTEADIDGLVRRVQEQGRRIVEVRPLRPTLEEVYFRTIGSNHELE